MRKHPRVTAMFLAAISGLIAALSFQSEHFYNLAWVAFVPLLVFFLGFPSLVMKRYLVTVCFSFAFFYHGSILAWMYQMKENLPIHEALAVVAISVAILAAVLQFGIALVIALLPFCYLKLQGAIKMIVFALLYTGVEWMQERFGLITFPFIRIGLSVTPNTAFIQSASLFGGLFITLLVLLVNGLIAYVVLLMYQNKKHLFKRLIAKDGIVLGIIGGVLVLNLLYGIRRYEVSKESEDNMIEVVLVQGNHSGRNKWNITSRELLDDYLRMTQEGITKATKLVVWPETAIPVNLTTNIEYLNELCNLCNTYEIELVIGAFDEDQTRNLNYNAMYLITKDGIHGEPYYKQKLVPFGEYLPFAKLIKSFAPQLVSGIFEVLSDDPGVQTVIQESSYGKIGGIICYESIYPKIARDSVKQGAQVFALISNDSWFGNSPALYQHHSQALMRAVENQRYVLRASNTGITSVIDAYGRVRQKLRTDQPLVLRENIKLYDHITLYTRVGDVIVIPSALLWIYGITIGFLKKRKIKKWS